jgi:hypothetical protein
MIFHFHDKEDQLGIFYFVCLCVALLIAWFGFIGPFCISIAATPLVVGWIVATIVLLPLFVKMIVGFAKKQISKIEKAE